LEDQDRQIRLLTDKVSRMELHSGGFAQLTKGSGKGGFGGDRVRDQGYGDGPSQNFMPESVYVRGFAVWSDDSTALGRDAYVHEMTRIMSALHPELRGLVTATGTPWMRNRQLSFRVLGGREQCWQLRNGLMEVLKAGYTIRGKQCYAVVQPSPERRARIAAIAQGLAAAQSYFAPLRVVPDWPANALYIGPPNREMCMGVFRNGSWKWNTADLGQIKQDFDLESFLVVLRRQGE